MDNDQQMTVAAANAPALSAEDQALIDKYSHTFIGSYAHSLDNKGRLVVPQAFREDLGQTFYISPSLDFKSICLYTNLEWARTRDQYGRLGKLSGRFMKYLDQFDALSYRGQECDGQGRVLLPAKLRQLVLGDEKDVEITGATDHVRIVSEKVSEAMLKEVLASGDEFQSLFDELSKMLLNDQH